MTKTYVTTVIEDGEDLILPFPDGLMEEMGWKEGDTLDWTSYDGYAVIKKVEDPTVIFRSLEGTNEDSGVK